jgi:hypothetical protein
MHVIIKHASYEFVLNFADELAQLQQLREWGALTHERHEQVAAGLKDSFMLNAMGREGVLTFASTRFKACYHDAVVPQKYMELFAALDTYIAAYCRHYHLGGRGGREGIVRVVVSHRIR